LFAAVAIRFTAAVTQHDGRLRLGWVALHGVARTGVLGEWHDSLSARPPLTYCRQESTTGA